MLRIFTLVKIQRLRPGLNPAEAEASMLTTRPPKHGVKVKIKKYIRIYTTLFLQPVLDFTLLLSSHNSLCSHRFRCLLTPSSGRRSPTAVPSQHVNSLCALTSCVLQIVLFSHTPVSVSLKFSLKCITN
jgi:hypothetical protein